MKTNYSHSTAAVEAVAGRPEPASSAIRNSIALSINDAAAAIGMSRWWIHERMKDGTLPYRKMGRRTLIMPADLKAMIDKLPVRHGPPTKAA